MADSKRTYPPFEERFWSKVDLNGPGGCWIWLASKAGGGYGKIKEPAPSKRWVLAHRVTYEWFVGPIAKGLDIDHLCRVPECCNPAHLEAVTHQENILRGNTFAAANASATHCPQGHPYSPENTYMYDCGTHVQRLCMECRRQRCRQYYWRRKGRERDVA